MRMRMRRMRRRRRDEDYNDAALDISTRDGEGAHLQAPCKR